MNTKTMTPAQYYTDAIQRFLYVRTDGELMGNAWQFVREAQDKEFKPDKTLALKIKQFLKNRNLLNAIGVVRTRLALRKDMQ